MRGKILFLTLQLVTLILAGPAKVQVQDEIRDEEVRLARKVDDLNKMEKIGIYGDMISLEKVAVEEEPETAGDETDRLIESVERFLRSRRLQIKLPNDGSAADMFGRALGQKNVEFEMRALTEGASEARTKLKRILIPILLALKLKAIIVLPIVMTLIGLIGIKGLGAGMMALLLSGAVALKALLTPPPPPRVTYGIVKPHDIHHDHWHRSQEEINQPYRGWAPEYSPDNYPYQELP